LVSSGPKILKLCGFKEINEAKYLPSSTISCALISPGFLISKANFVQSSNAKGLGLIPPLVIGFLPILLAPFGANSRISLIGFPLKSNNSCGLYDLSHFSSSLIYFGSNAETGIGT
jgi:hypothetical protein